MNFLRHIVVLFKRRLNNQDHTTVIDANPASQHFPHISFDLRLEADNPYPVGSVSITNFHKLGAAALPGGICVIRAGYYRAGEWPPVIYAGRPFSLETEWQGQDSKTTIGLGLPGELFNEANVRALKRPQPLADVLISQGSPQLFFDRANLEEQLQNRGQAILLPKGYTAGPLPIGEWMSDVLDNSALGTAHYWTLALHDRLNVAHIQVFHQLRANPLRRIRVRRIDMTGLPSPKIALDGESGVDFETILNHRFRLTSSISLEFEDPGRETTGGFSNWRPVMIQHTGDNFTGNFRTQVSARAIK